MGLGDGLGIQGAVQATWESGNSRSRGTTDPIAAKGTVLEAAGGCWEVGALGPLRAIHTWTNQSLGGSVQNVEKWEGQMFLVWSQRVARYLVPLMEGSRNGGCLRGFKVRDFRRRVRKATAAHRPSQQACQGC